MFEQGNGVDLDRLNDAERQVLQLLAEGHTAKSVANVLGSTPAAVNERLREARRKTGASSSRELARLLKSQENRDEQMGVGKPPLLPAHGSVAGAEPWRPHKGVVAMTTLFIVAAGAAMALMGPGNTPAGEVDPLLGTPLQTGPDPAALHAQIRAEARDPDWASRTERAIRDRALQIPLIGKDGNTLRVTCASKLCEIAGSIQMSKKSQAEYDPKLPESRAQAALQTPPFVDDISKLGLKNESGLFTGAKGKDDQIVFILYYSRAK
jgi:DNA-binding CsgD family transcriptional regulator